MDKPEQSNKYSEKEALEEASQMRELVGEKGRAEDYDVAEELLEKTKSDDEEVTTPDLGKDDSPRKVEMSPIEKYAFPDEESVFGQKSWKESLEENTPAPKKWKGLQNFPVPARKEKPEQNEKKSTEKDKIEDSLWTSAESAQQMRVFLEKRIGKLVAEVTEMRKNRLNLHEQEIMDEKEQKLLLLTRQLEQKKQEEEEIQKKLESLENGSMSFEVKHELTQALQENDSLSKRKQRIQEERDRILEEMKRTGEYSEHEPGKALKIATQLARQGGKQGPLTTGRHASHIKNVDTSSAEGEFYFHSADTHGGKVGYGKRPRKDAGGRTVRKS
ncbi:MAG: hypothetical protein AAB581_03345 [Patescibacteria group bacterium]